MSRLTTFVLLFCATVALTIAFGALLALPVMWLWNGLFTTPESIIGTALPPIDFWRAWALLVLTGILVRAGSSSPKSK